MAGGSNVSRPRQEDLVPLLAHAKERGLGQATSPLVFSQMFFDRVIDRLNYHSLEERLRHWLLGISYPTPSDYFKPKDGGEGEAEEGAGQVLVYTKEGLRLALMGCRAMGDPTIPWHESQARQKATEYLLTKTNLVDNFIISTCTLERRGTMLVPTKLL